MDTLPLPPRPSLEDYRKLAKGLVACASSSDPGAVRAWAAHWLQSLAALLEVPITPFVQASMDRAVTHIEARVREKSGSGPRGAPITLDDAHSLVADAHGFEGWTAFEQHLQHLTEKGAKGDEFEIAADAIVAGDLATLQEIVRQRPDLIRARSARVHRATLLHYVAANGVEDFRQKTPRNAVAVARLLLESGAEVDALANTYSGGWYGTTMNLLVSSAHPAGAGLQAALVEVLIDFGAAANGLQDDESPLMTALDFNYPGAAMALVRRGARVDNVVTAAALGRLDLVRSFVLDRGALRTVVPLVAPPWLRLPNEPKTHLELAFVWACKFAHTAIAEFLMDKGVDPAARDGYKMTALHYAAVNGCMDVIDQLLARGAPLEVQNVWGGTVLDSTAYCAIHLPVQGVNYLDVMERLIRGGADVRAAHPTDNEPIDDLLQRHGAGAG